EIRMRLLQRLQFNHEPVVFGIRDDRVVQHIITMIMVGDFAAQIIQALRRRQPAAACRHEKILTVRSVPDWKPACDSLLYMSSSWPSMAWSAPPDTGCP